MSLVLIRIDDRLIHGQVTVGWGSYLNPDRIILVSDEVARNDWEKELYKSCVPYNITVSILSVDEAAASLGDAASADERVIMLVESPSDIVGLIERGAAFQQVNIGGMHYKSGKKKILPFVYVDENDIGDFKKIMEHNVELVCQELPQSKKTSLAALLELP